MKVAGVEITSPDRLVYPEQGVSKRALAEYYEAVAGLMLPHIKGRPLSLVRCPAGRGGSCFYQKHWRAQGSVPIETRLVKEEEGNPEPYAFASSAKHLVALVQMGVLEIHAWGSRFDALESPDRVIFDLDPGPGIAWPAIRDAAQTARALLAELGFESWPKVTGGKGVHVVVPIQRGPSWETVSLFARAVAERLVRDAPNDFVAKAAKSARDRRIFVDWLRNSRGATAVAPYSTRSREGAPIALPVSWDVLEQIDGADEFTLAEVRQLVATGFTDPWSDMLTARQRLNEAAVERLST